LGKENFMSDFGKMLNKARLKRGLSLGQLAKHMGVTAPYISDIENGKRAPFPIKLETYAKLENMLAVPTVELIKQAAKDPSRRFFELEVGNNQIETLVLFAQCCERGLTAEEIKKIAEFYNSSSSNQPPLPGRSSEK